MSRGGFLTGAVGGVVGPPTCVDIWVLFVGYLGESGVLKKGLFGDAD